MIGHLFHTTKTSISSMQVQENSYLVKGKIVLNVEKAKPTFDVKGPLESKQKVHQCRLMLS